MRIADKSRATGGLAVLAAGCFVLQAALAPNIGIEGARMNFALVFCAVCALTRGGTQGVLCGFGAGLVFDLLGTGPIGLMGFIATAASYVLGLEQRNRMGSDFGGSMAAFAAFCLACSVAYGIGLALAGQGGDPLWGILLDPAISTALSCVGFAPFALYFSRQGGSSSLSGGRSFRRGF